MDRRKNLGQQAPAATTDTALYTTPAGKSAVASTLAVCNRSASEETFRIAVRVAGAALENKQYLHYDQPLPAKTTAYFTIGMTLFDGDIVSVRSSGGGLSFGLFGAEET